AVARASMGAIVITWLRCIFSLGVFAGTLGGFALGGAVYWGASLLLRSDEARLFTNAVTRRLRRRSSDE
ncbi:MAG: hypothetical protein ACFB51_02390, partial [Anaerolineae bacterium]